MKDFVRVAVQALIHRPGSGVDLFAKRKTGIGY